MLDSTGFDLWANEYDKTVNFSEEANEYPFAGYKDVLNTIYKRIKSGNGKTILDTGFGTGVLSKKLYDEGVGIFGIDFSQEMIKLAKEKMPNAALYQYDFSKGLPYQLDEKKFDYIICTYAIHHLTDTEKSRFIKDLKNRLTPNGEILLGDVAFETNQALKECRRKAGDEWDDEEFYLVAEELSKKFPNVIFEKISFCSGVFVIKNSGG